MSAESVYLDLFGRGLRLRADDDGRLIVSPGELLTDADRVAIRHHRDELLAIVAYADAPLLHAEPRREHDVPSLCVGPIACRVLGVCGRLGCMTDAERGVFEVAVFNARAERTPHRVTRLVDPQHIVTRLVDPQHISLSATDQEADRAA